MKRRSSYKWWWRERFQLHLAKGWGKNVITMAIAQCVWNLMLYLSSSTCYFSISFLIPSSFVRLKYEILYYKKRNIQHVCVCALTLARWGTASEAAKLWCRNNEEAWTRLSECAYLLCHLFAVEFFRGLKFIYSDSCCCRKTLDGDVSFVVLFRTKIKCFLFFCARMSWTKNKRRWLCRLKSSKKSLQQCLNLHTYLSQVVSTNIMRFTYLLTSLA